MLRPTDFVIDARTPFGAYHFPLVGGEIKGKGCVPRDYAAQPAEMFDPPSAMALIPRSEWPERIRDLEATRSALSHVRGDIPSLDQGSNGYCWAHSTTHAVMLARAVANMPYVPLSAYAVAATIKQGRNEGGWGPLSAQFIRDRGVPSQALWPQGDRNYRQYDRPEVWADAARHRIVEEWVDLTRQVYDRNVTFDQLGSGVLCRQPGPVDYNHWGHSICACDLVDGVASYDAGLLRDLGSGKLMTREAFDLLWMDEVTAGFGLRIWNSWSDGWGDRGMGVLAGQKAVPDGAMLIRAVTASIA